MENYVKRLGLMPGDKIEVLQLDNTRETYTAIYLGIDQYKRHFMGELTDDDKVKLVEVKDFFSRDNQITKLYKHKGDWQSRQEAVNDSLIKTGQFNKLLDLDTEHFRNEYLRNRTKRLSLLIGGGLGVLAAAAALAALRINKEM